MKFHRRSQGVYWVHVHGPQGGEKNWAKFTGESCKCTTGRAMSPFFRKMGIGEICTVGVVNLVVLACVWSRARLKRSSTFSGKKSAPQRKYWLRLGSKILYDGEFISLRRGGGSARIFAPLRHSLIVIYSHWVSNTNLSINNVKLKITIRWTTLILYFHWILFFFKYSIPLYLCVIFVLLQHYISLNLAIQ